MSRTEIIDVLGEDGAVLRQMPRDEAERANHMSANALVFVFNLEGLVWVQLRPKHKTHFGGLWDITACGGLLSGESPLDAAARETVEETSLEPELHHVETFTNEFASEGGGPNHRRLSHLYIGITAQEPRLSDEADDFKLWWPRELRADVQAHPKRYVPPFLFEFDKALEAHAQLVRARQTK